MGCAAAIYMAVVSCGPVETAGSPSLPGSPSVTGSPAGAGAAMVGAAGGATSAPGTVAPLESLRPGRALLVQGARAVKGLPGLGRNALPALAGEYSYLPAKSGGAALAVSVWYTREPVPVPPAWSAAPCEKRPAGYAAWASPPEPDGSVVWALQAQGFTLFIRAPGGMADPCAFASVFAERVSFFERYAERPEDSSFPAVLEIGP